jgi:hypothetical protein
MFSNLPAVHQAFLEKLMTRKGQIVTVKTKRPMKMLKHMEQVFKTSDFQCRVGVDYDNIATVKEGRANGELPAENQGLPWGEWAVFPYIIRHTKKGATQEDLYVRCTMLNNGYRKAPVFELADGTVLSKDDVKAMTAASEFKDSDSAVFNITLSSVLEVK